MADFLRMAQRQRGEKQSRGRDRFARGHLKEEILAGEYVAGREPEGRKVAISESRFRFPGGEREIIVMSTSRSLPREALADPG